MRAAHCRRGALPWCLLASRLYPHSRALISAARLCLVDTELDAACAQPLMGRWAIQLPVRVYGMQCHVRFDWRDLLHGRCLCQPERTRPTLSLITLCPRHPQRLAAGGSGKGAPASKPLPRY